MRALFGDRVTDVVARRRTLQVDHFERPEDFRDYFKAFYGPTIAVYKAIADDPERVAALDVELADLTRRFDREDGHGLGVPAAHGAQALNGARHDVPRTTRAGGAGCLRRT